MKTNVIFFGQIQEILGCDQLMLSDVNNTEQLVDELVLRYPALSKSKYAIAVNKKIIIDKMWLNDNDVVAFLPPFSGG